jgi:hypothetical protein
VLEPFIGFNTMGGLNRAQGTGLISNLKLLEGRSIRIGIRIRAVRGRMVDEASGRADLGRTTGARTVRVTNSGRGRSCRRARCGSDLVADPQGIGGRAAYQPKASIRSTVK